MSDEFEYERTQDDYEPDEVPKGTVFGRNKGMFLLLFVVVALYLAVFLLYSFDVINLLVLDLILLPVTAIIFLWFVSIKKRR